jgi:hypothetical protein
MVESRKLVFAMKNNYKNKNKKPVSPFYYTIFLYIVWAQFIGRCLNESSVNKTSILITKYHGVRVNHGNAETSRDYKIIIVSLSLRTAFLLNFNSRPQICGASSCAPTYFLPCRPRALYYLAEFLLSRRQLVPVRRLFLLSFYFRVIVVSDADNNVYTVHAREGFYECSDVRGP